MPKSLKFLRPYMYAGRRHPAGAIVDVRSKDAVLLKAFKVAEDAPPPAPAPKPDPPKPATLPAPDPTTFPPIADLPPLLPAEPKPQPTSKKKSDRRGED
jgi:hypothetical protein